jgi:hypothetical protein
VDDIVGITRDDWVKAILDSWEHGPNCTCDHDVDRIVNGLIQQVDQIPVGAVVERHLRRLNVRTLTAS